MRDLNAAFAGFDIKEIETLTQAYGFGLRYLDFDLFIDRVDFCLFARLTIMTGVGRLRGGKSLASIVDAHALAADAVDIFAIMRELRTEASSRNGRPS